MSEPRVVPTEPFSSKSQCGICGEYAMIRNPHPDAGKPQHLVKVGAVYECVLCLCRARAGWSERARTAEKELRERPSHEAVQAAVEVLDQYLGQVTEKFGSDCGRAGEIRYAIAGLTGKGVMENHVWVERCDDPYCDGTCNLCNLQVCKVCNLYEGGLTTECPGVPSGGHADAVYEGRKDFRDGKWITLKPKETGQ